MPLLIHNYQQIYPCMVNVVHLKLKLKCISPWLNINNISIWMKVIYFYHIILCFILHKYDKVYNSMTIRRFKTKIWKTTYLFLSNEFSVCVCVCNAIFFGMYHVIISHRTWLITTPSWNLKHLNFVVICYEFWAL